MYVSSGSNDGNSSAGGSSSEDGNTFANGKTSK